MANLVMADRIKLPPPLRRIEQSSFVWYKYWEASARLLRETVVKPAETAILGLSTYTNQQDKKKKRPKMPTVEVTEQFDVGSIKVEITTKPAKPPVSYEAVYSRFTSFVNALIDQHTRKGKSRGRRDDVRKIAEESYVEVSVVKDMLAVYLKEAQEKAIRKAKKEKKQNIDQEINLKEVNGESPSRLSVIPEDFTIFFQGRNYSVATEDNVVIFQQAINMLEEGQRRTVGYTSAGDKKRVNMFKELLRADSLAQVGGRPTEVSRVPYSYRHLGFINQLEPRTRHSYEDMIDEFLRNTPELNKIKDGSRVGDFGILERFDDEALIARLTEKEIIDEKFMKDYKPVRDGDKVFIRLKGLLARIELYKKERDGAHTEQNIYLNWTSLLTLPQYLEEQPLEVTDKNL